MKKKILKILTATILMSLFCYVIYINTDKIWQDYVFLFGSFVFILTLIPTMVRNSKIPRSTSIPTSLILSIFAITFLTIDLELSFVGNSLLASIWVYIAVFRSIKEDLSNVFSRENIITLILTVLVILVLYIITDRIFQDYVFLFGTFLLTISLIPTIINRESSIPRITSIPSFIILTIYFLAFLQLDLVFSAVGNLLNGFAWFYIALFRNNS